MQPTAAGPARVEALLEPRLSGWSLLVKWLLAIPHYAVLALLWLAVAALNVIVFIAIMITGRYPRPLFELNLGVLRWSWRVGYYVCSVLGADRYPPFTLTAATHYPACLHIDYPQRVSRGSVLVRWGTLALPLYLGLGGAGYLAARFAGLAAGPLALAGLVALAAGVLLAWRHPEGCCDAVLGMNRWALRAVAALTLMTGTAAPLRFEPGSADLAPVPPRVTPPTPRPQQGVPEPAVPAQLAKAPPATPAREPLPSWVMVLFGVGATAVLGAAVWVADHLQPDDALRTVARFVHLAALVLGFGAVLAVDWFALLWLVGRRSLEELGTLVTAAHLPIWLGLVGLVLSGALCQPDLSLPLTWIKLGLVLLVTLNGLHAYALSARLLRHRGQPMPRRLLRRAGISAGISQLGWWGAMIIGFLNAQ